MLIQAIGADACNTARKMLNAIHIIFFFQLVSFYFDRSILHLSILFFQFSLYFVAYLGASRFNQRLLKMYISLRITLWVANLLFLIFFLLYPEYCLTHLAPLFNLYPSELIASHVHHLSTLGITLIWTLYQLVSFFYTFLIVYSVVAAYRLLVALYAAQSVLPIEIARAAQEQQQQSGFVATQELQDEKPLKPLSPPQPTEVYALPPAALDVELHPQNDQQQHYAVYTQVPLDDQHNFATAFYPAHALYPQITSQ